MSLLRLPEKVLRLNSCLPVLRDRCKNCGKFLQQNARYTDHRTSTTRTTTKSNFYTSSNLAQEKNFATSFHSALQEDYDLDERFHEEYNSKHFMDQNVTSTEKHIDKTVDGVPPKTHFMRMMENSPYFLCNYVQACFGAGSVQELTVFLTSLIECKSSSVNEWILENYFQGIVDLPKDTKENPLEKVHQLLLSIINSDTKLTVASSGYILAAMQKFGQDEESFQVIFQGFNHRFPIQESLEYFAHDTEICNLLLEVMSRFDSPKPAPFIAKDSSDSDFLYQQPLLRDLMPTEVDNTAVKLSPDLELDLEKEFEEQLRQEIIGTVKIPNIIAKPSQKKAGVDAASNRLKKLKETLRRELLCGFRHKKDEEKAIWHRKRRGTYPFLCILPEKDYVDIMLNNLFNIPKNGEKVSSIGSRLGKAIYSKFLVSTKLKNGIDKRLVKIYTKYLKLYTDEANLCPRQMWLQLEKLIGKLYYKPLISPWHDKWNFFTGLRLLEVMVSTASFTLDGRGLKSNVRLPTLFTTYTVWGKKMCGLAIPHPLFSNLITQTSKDFEFDNTILPMLSPPKPWISSTQGGYLFAPNDFIRSISGCPDANDHNPNFTINPVMDALNVISSVAWKLNDRILDLQLKIFLNKGDQDLDIPPPASESPPPPSLQGISDLSPKEQSLLYMEIREAKKNMAEMHSLHCDTLYKLSIANFYRKKTIWFPHNLDFRGRAYPISRHLNYMGSDPNRAMFLFAEGKQLGREGLDWLKIHLVNLSGFKKHESVEARLQYANEILDEIFDSADNPLTGRCWWKKCDEPWQTLSACMELTDALRCPDPTKFVSHLPIHQDGSCNGLQHYAAMGRDVIGAHQVNLSPSPVPQDIYSRVAEEVEKKRSQDAEKGVEIAQQLEGVINRKVVKQTVMTTVYGVTRYGGALQIRKQIQDSIPRSVHGKGSSYLVNLLFNSLSSMFTSAINIQKWFNSLASCVSSSGHSMEWITPLGIKVIQPYFHTREEVVRSTLQNVNLVKHESQPNTIKQCNAFSPNFVHSLDSSHMMLTALACYRDGVTFSSVHDCYWTHACHVNLMNKLCREQFINLHSQPILEDLAQHLHKFLEPDRFNTNSSHVNKLSKLLTEIPEKGDFDLEEVKKSVYFFS